MAFISSNIVHDGWSGTKTRGNLVDTFSVQYVVQVDDKQDGPRFILEDCSLPFKGDLYAAGNESHPMAVCTGVSVSPLGEKLWRATASYGPKSKEDGEAEDAGLDAEEEPTDDPLSEGFDLAISLVQMSKPATRAIYLGQTKSSKGAVLVQLNWAGGPDSAKDATALGSAAGLFTGVPVTNSCGVMYDPPPEIDYSRIQVSITRNQKKFDANNVLKYNDTVNSNAFQIKQKKMKLDVPALGAKMQTIGGTRMVKEGLVYWRVSYEFHIDDIFGWRMELLDRGYGLTSLFDQDAGIARSTSDVPEGMGQVQPIVNDNGFTPNEPVNLDGQGMPLKPNETPVYLVYGVYREVDWGPLKLNKIGKAV